MTAIFAIDPGPRLSAYVELVGARIVAHDKIGNMALLGMLRGRDPRGPLVVEMMAPYGRIVGREVFETLLWTGRFLEAWRGVGRLLERREVKQALGLQVGARGSTDADVRRALIERWGGKATRRRLDMPEPLRGIVEDQWAALAVGVAWRVRHGDAFEAVEGAPLSGLEDLNRALGLLSGPTQQELHTADPKPVCQLDHIDSRSEREAPIPSDQHGSGGVGASTLPGTRRGCKRAPQGKPGAGAMRHEPDHSSPPEGVQAELDAHRW